MSTFTQDNLEGQRALVTGATSDIGRAVALHLARDGAEVASQGIITKDMGGGSR